MTMLHGNSNESCHFILLVCKALHVKIAICTTRLVGKGSLLLQTVLKINQMLSLKCSYLKKKKMLAKIQARLFALSNIVSG